MSRETVREVLGTLHTGSLAWRLTRLKPGEFLLESDAHEHIRKHCMRAMTQASQHEAGAAFDLTLCYGMKHDATGGNFRCFKITRTS
ncbi:hypothetical protein [Paraburkholderia sp. MM5477-R1]|uniref:hypothetical protein n=1 Tax=Paraburkholderia sp. MM5477-R1 TaxID=2991062 RepID=UPI003D1ACD86